MSSSALAASNHCRRPVTFVAVRTGAGDVCLGNQSAGRFQIRNGNEIIIEPAEGADGGVLQEMILGPALAVLLRQRGILVLHASAVVIDGRGVAFLGSTGVGKSTTAAALHARGHGVVADDVVAVREDAGAPHVFAAHPQLNLWPDTVASLGHTPDLLPRLHRRVEKRAFATDGCLVESLPLTRIYVLATGSRTQIEPAQPQGAFVELLRHSYAGRLLQKEAPGEHFHQCTRLLATVAVCRLTVRPALSELRDLAGLVEQHVVSRNGLSS